MKLVIEEHALINKKSSLPKFDNIKYGYDDKDGKIYIQMNGVLSNKRTALEVWYAHDIFKLLDHGEFNKEVTAFLDCYTLFNQVVDLSEFKGKKYYVLVLDEYCQVYIGTSGNNLKWWNLET